MPSAGVTDSFCLRSAPEGRAAGSHPGEIRRRVLAPAIGPETINRGRFVLHPRASRSGCKELVQLTRSVLPLPDDPYSGPVYADAKDPRGTAAQLAQQGLSCREAS